MNHYDPDTWLASAVEPVNAACDFLYFTSPYRSVRMVSKAKGTPFFVGKLAGHNALTFDLPILKALVAKASSFFPFSYHVRDTLQRALFFYDENPNLPRPENLKLTTIASSLGIPTDGAHNALTDVRLSAAIAKAFGELSVSRPEEFPW